MTPAELDGAAQVPLIEQLRSVPKNAREFIKVDDYAHRNIPYGRMCHEAADAIAALRSDLAAKEADAEKNGRLLLEKASETRRALDRAEKSEADHDALRINIRQMLGYEQDNDDLMTVLSERLDAGDDAQKERDAAVHALMELRMRLHAAGRRPEECYEMSLIDDAISTARKP